MKTARIVAIGQTPFGRLSDRSIIELAAEAAGEALAADGIEPTDVGGLFFGSLAPLTLGGQAFPAAVLAARLGLTGIPSFALEGACASGSLAFVQAVSAVRSGAMDVALVVGAESMSGHPTPTVTEALARVADTQSESFHAGLTFPGFFALVARRYLAEYGVDREALADVVAKNRGNGAKNPLAHFQQPVEPEEALSSRPIAEPLCLFDCSPISDGAAAIVVASEEWARGRDLPLAVDILATEPVGGAVSAETMEGFLSFPAAREATARALARAGVERSEIDVVEAHDCFSIAEWIAIEDMGFCGRGEAAAATSDGMTAVDGDIPVNPSGGLLSKGHPIGATGVGQLIEIAKQVSGTAANQVAGAELGLAHNIGGTGGMAVVSILQGAR